MYKSSSHLSISVFFLDMEFLEVLTEGLEKVLMVRGGGREVITIYSWTWPAPHQCLCDSILTVSVVFFNVPKFALGYCSSSQNGVTLTRACRFLINIPCFLYKFGVPFSCKFEISYDIFCWICCLVFGINSLLCRYIW